MGKGYKNNTKGRRNVKQERKKGKPRHREKKQINPLEIKQQTQSG